MWGYPHDLGTPQKTSDTSDLLRPRCIAPAAFFFAVLLFAPGLQVKQFLFGSLGWCQPSKTIRFQNHVKDRITEAKSKNDLHMFLFCLWDLVSDCCISPEKGWTMPFLMKPLHASGKTEIKAPCYAWFVTISIDPSFDQGGSPFLVWGTLCRSANVAFWSFQCPACTC